MPGDDFALTQCLTAFGLADTETNRQQLHVLLKAMRIFQQRNAEHADLWAEQQLDDAAHHVKSKALRLHAAASRGADDMAHMLDSALDGINYNAFAVRHLLGLLPDYNHRQGEG